MIEVRDLLMYEDNKIIGFSNHTLNYTEESIVIGRDSVINNCDIYYSTSEGLCLEYSKEYTYIKDLRALIKKYNIPLDEKVIMWDSDDGNIITFNYVLENMDYVVLV